MKDPCFDWSMRVQTRVFILTIEARDRMAGSDEAKYPPCRLATIATAPMLQVALFSAGAIVTRSPAFVRPCCIITKPFHP